MAIPSRHMSPRPVPERGHGLGWVVVAAMATVTLAFLVKLISFNWLFAPGFIIIALVWFLVDRARCRRLRALALARSGKRIGDFARAFDLARVDAWVVRAVYEALEAAASPQGARLPIHPDDDLTGTLAIDEDALDFEIFNEIATRAGRSLDGTQHNPFCGKVRTAREMVMFFNAQPRA